MQGARAERRKDSRADLRVPVELSHGVDGGEVLSLATLNIGAGGVYVEVPRHIPPLTKLWLSLQVPGPTPQDPVTSLETEAIVVRTLPEEEEEGRTSYEIACAFLALSEEHRDAINRYVLTHRARTPA